MQVRTPKGRWLVPPQRAVWLPPGLVHAVDMLADIEMRSLYLDRNWLMRHPLAPQLGREFVVAVRPLLREVVLALFEDGGGDGAGAHRRDLLSRLVLFELAEAEDATTFMPVPSDPRARRVAELMLSDPGGRLDLDGLAQAAGASARTITRLFTAETELTFKQWRQRARILSAVETLGGGGGSIKQLSARLGFSSVAAFSHAFRQVMGMTPSEFLDRSVRPPSPVAAPSRPAPRIAPEGAG